ncbi:MAG TPA: hypothetical protein VNM47_15055 [Terriglobia bacterium]|nr:hypothetical protein [Terriglobia bacterium]
MKILTTACTLGLAFVLTGQLKYSNPTYGLSLQYPKSYQVIEGKLGQNNLGLGYLGSIPMEFVAPGGVRIVTIEAPNGSYPGTDFVNAFFTVSVNRHLTKEECEQFPTDLSNMSRPAGEKEINGLGFKALREGEGGLGHQWGGTYYHGFSDGLCYELGYGLATAGYGSVDGMKKVNGGEVFAILERVLKSVAISVPKGAIRPSNFPSIRSFEVTPLRAGARSGTYNVSWDVEGAEPSQVWLSAVNCLGYLTIHRLTDNGKEEPAFPCGTLEPTGSIKSSMTLEFRNMSGSKEEETVRLFAAGRRSVSINKTISPPPLPVIISIDTDGNRYLIDYRHPHRYTQNITNHEPLPAAKQARRYVQIVAGHGVNIGGVAFLPTDTLWIGSRSIAVTRPDSQNINFTVPPALPDGLYSMSIVGDHGRSNPVTVQIVR